MQYKEMTYATVRGAGHMVSVPCDMMLHVLPLPSQHCSLSLPHAQVPGTQPLYALDMFKGFLSGQL